MLTSRWRVLVGTMIVCTAFAVSAEIDIEGRLMTAEAALTVTGGTPCNGDRPSQACGTGTQACDTSTVCENVGQRCAGTSTESTSGSMQECVPGAADEHCSGLGTVDSCVRKSECQCKAKIGDDKCGKVAVTGVWQKNHIFSVGDCTTPGG